MIKKIHEIHSLFLVKSSLVSRPNGFVVSAIDIIQASSMAQEIVSHIDEKAEILSISAMSIDLLKMVEVKL